MFIYCIVNSETLKIYIGQHKGNNLRKYLQTKFSDARHQVELNSRLDRSMRKWPKEVWSIHPLVSDVRTREELDELEKHFIRVLNSRHPDVGYNILAGGEGHKGPVTEETRQKISTSLKGKSKTEEHNRHVSEALMGRPNPKSSEFRQQVSETLKGRPKSAEHAQHIGEGHRGLVYNLGNNWNVGRKQSQETIEKRKAANAGFRHSEKAKAKMRHSKSPETIQHMREAQQARRAQEKI